VKLGQSVAIAEQEGARAANAALNRWVVPLKVS
jgi:hypothetical protein